MRRLKILKKWLIATRPFALTASLVPTVFGASLALQRGDLSEGGVLFVLTLLAVILLHSGANMLSDVQDHRRGVDKGPPDSASGAVVRGLLTEKTVFRGALVLLGCGLVPAFLLACLTGRELWIIGAVGVSIGVLYTPLKYKALGDLAVFVTFGLLCPLGSWVVQTKTFSWLPVVWSIPLGLLVVAILHSNNWRDIESDGEANIRTCAMLLGERGSLVYYAFLVWTPFIMVSAAIFASGHLSGVSVPPTMILVWAALPKTFKCWKKARCGADKLETLDLETARLHLLFGVLSVVALGVDALLPY